MENFQYFYIPEFKKGNKILIKKKNRGKFTASAKKAGKSVQQHAKDVLNDPNATPLQKKRANFARNSAKWKHESGSKIHKPFGHRSVLDNSWESTKQLKNKKNVIPRAQLGRVLDFVKHPFQHIENKWAGAFPDEKTYKNTIYIDKENQRLHYYDADGNLVLNSPVSTGANIGNKTKQGDNKTPEGNFWISHSTDKADKRKFGDTLFYGLSYGRGIGIHGDAGNPNALGRRASHGCIRMPNGELRKLQGFIGKGIRVPVIIGKD